MYIYLLIYIFIDTLIAGYCPCYLNSRSPNTIKATNREKLHSVKISYDSNTTHEIAVKYFVLFRCNTLILLKNETTNKQHLH